MIIISSRLVIRDPCAVSYCLSLNVNFKIFALIIIDSAITFRAQLCFRFLRRYYSCFFCFFEIDQNPHSSDPFSFINSAKRRMLWAILKRRNHRESIIRGIELLRIYACSRFRSLVSFSLNIHTCEIPFGYFP